MSNTKVPPDQKPTEAQFKKAEELGVVFNKAEITRNKMCILIRQALRASGKKFNLPGLGENTQKGVRQTYKSVEEGGRVYRKEEERG